MKKLCLAFFVLFLLMAENAFAIGIGPSRTIIDFEPGLSRTMVFQVVNTGNKAMDVELYKAGDLSEYITLSTDSLAFSPSETIKSFTVYFTLPQSIAEPGRHDNRIGAVEAAPEGEWIGARAGVEAQIWFNVPYEGIYAEISLDVPDVELGESVPFSISIRNLGTENMTVSGEILIYSDGVQVASLNSGSVFVEPRETGTLQSTWSTQGVKAGQYKAVAVVTYGGKKSEVEKIFRVGALYAEIINISSATAVLGDIAQFDIALQSMWNEPISDVYIELEIMEDGSPVSKTRSETFSLTPWEVKTVKIYTDSEGLTARKYDVRATLYYADKAAVKELEGGLEVVAFSFDSITLLLIIAIIVIVAGFVLVYEKKKRGK